MNLDLIASTPLASTVIQWLWQSSLIFSLVSALLLLVHRRLLAILGARTLYPLWVLLPVCMLLPVIAQTLGATLSPWFNISPLAPVQGFMTYTGADVAEVSQSSASLIPLVLALLWLIPCIALTVAFAIRQYTFSQVPKGTFKGLTCIYHASRTSPGISGFFKPCLHLPVDFTSQFTRNQQRLIIQHELTHWRRGDLRINSLAWLVVAAQWFNPFAWFAYRRFRADQELACDAMVLSNATPKTNHSLQAQVCYANALLAAMQSVSSKAHTRSLLTNAACTHYGNKQGAKAMAHERLSQLNQTKPALRWPLAMSASALILTGLVALAPASAHNHAQSQQKAPSVSGQSQQPIVRIIPRYPEYAEQQQIEGYVDLSFVINNEGKVSNIEVLDSEPTGIFNEEAIQALSRWRYVPQNDLPQTVRLQFKMDKEEAQ